MTSGGYGTLRNLACKPLIFLTMLKPEAARNHTEPCAVIGLTPTEPSRNQLRNPTPHTPYVVPCALRGAHGPRGRG